MYISPASFFVSVLFFIDVGRAAPCALNAPYSTLETAGVISGGQGCKYVPEVCRGLPEQLLASSPYIKTMRLTALALARAAPADPLNIAARDLLKSFEGSTPEEQRRFVSSHCAALTPSKIACSSQSLCNISQR
ncbi:hypothetical protein DFH09DRAFT_1308429 [Mycena vulgaris]|nr:hypothetical protein DFH09DRAFT_1308429 [Mycena vulgaris]